MKILSIGNSFSQDAHRWLVPLAEAYGEEIAADLLSGSPIPRLPPCTFYATLSLTQHEGGPAYVNLV